MHLNNAGAALMPRRVLECITGHLQLESEIGGYEAADARAEAVERTYADIATLVGASPRYRERFDPQQANRRVLDLYQELSR